jgi:methylated-DNA-[protein]-cysteine S-methyltransferase
MTKAKRELLFLHEKRVNSPIGEMVLLTDADGSVRVLEFADHADRTRTLLNRCYGQDGWQLIASARLEPAADAIDRYFRGDLTAIDGVATATVGTVFQRSVWAALRTVPAGETWSYRELAGALGHPSARAVGTANGANPISIIVPCHRIIGSSGALTGYGGGIERKRWLLDHEARHRAEAAVQARQA